MTPAFRFSGGDIIAGRDDRISLDDAIRMHKTAADRHILAGKSGEVEASLFYLARQRELEDAIRGASEWRRAGGARS